MKGRARSRKGGGERERLAVVVRRSLSWSPRREVGQATLHAHQPFYLWPSSLSIIGMVADSCWIYTLTRASCGCTPVRMASLLSRCTMGGWWSALSLHSECTTRLRMQLTRVAWTQMVQTVAAAVLLLLELEVEVAEEERRQRKPAAAAVPGKVGLVGVQARGPYAKRKPLTP